MIKSLILIVSSLCCGHLFASYSYAPNPFELDGKIINYYEITSETRDQVVLSSRGSELVLNNRANNFIRDARTLKSSTHNFSKDWKPLPHQLIINGQNRAEVVFSNKRHELYFDMMMGELYFNDRDLSDSFAPTYRKHFTRLFGHSKSPFASDFRVSELNDLLWISSMTCKNIALSKDCLGKPIKKGLRCSIEFIFDGGQALSNFSHF